jgi:putative ABC transport system permease protein
MPYDFRLPLDYRDVVPTELWIPAAIDQTAELPWGDRSFYIVGRLASGVTPAQATSDLHRAFAGWETLGFVKSEDTPPRGAVPLDDLLLRNVRPTLLVLFGAVGLILLIACANVAHLHLARADARRREVATQIALGASRIRLVRERLVESGVLAAGGAMLGTLLAWAGIRAALVLAPVQVIRMRDVELDLTVLAFTGALIVAVTILTGLWPALQVTRVRVSSIMAGARGDVTALRRGTRRALVVVETAVCLIPVLGAVLLARSFGELRAVDLGFRAERILTGDVQLPSVEYTAPERVIAFYEELTARLAALPGVEAVGAVRVLPLSRSIGEWSITLEDRRTDPERPDVSADWQIATPGYLETVGIGIRRGRTILRSDAADAPPVAVINETMAQRYWPDDDALGKRFHLGTLDQPWIEVVGIVGDVRRNDVIEDARAEMYLPHAQFRVMKGGGSPQMGMTVVVRSAGDPLALAPALRAQIRALDAALPVANVRTFGEVVDDALAAPRFAVLLLGVLAALSVVLAAIGLYGVLAFSAARRSREIGIRVALGARRGSVARLIMREGVLTAVVGIAIGLVASLWLSRYVESQLYGVSRLDPVSYVGVSLFLLSIALLASYLPARRASRASPMTALRVD